MVTAVFATQASRVSDEMLTEAARLADIVAVIAQHVYNRNTPLEKLRQTKTAERALRQASMQDGISAPRLIGEDPGLRGGHMKRATEFRKSPFPGVALIATAIGAAAVGGFAIGALAIGRFAIRRVLVESAQFKSLEIEDLTVTQLRAAEVTVSDSLKLPRNRGDRTTL
jgi:hypothetical protein